MKNYKRILNDILINPPQSIPVILRNQERFINPSNTVDILPGYLHGNPYYNNNFSKTSTTSQILSYHASAVNLIKQKEHLQRSINELAQYKRPRFEPTPEARRQTMNIQDAMKELDAEREKRMMY